MDLIKYIKFYLKLNIFIYLFKLIMGACASDENLVNKQKILLKTSSFQIEFDDKKQKIDTPKEINKTPIQYMIPSNLEVLIKNKSIILPGLMYAEKILKVIKDRVLNLDYYNSNFTVNFKSNEKLDKNEINQYFNDQLKINSLIHSTLYDFSEFYKPQDGYFTSQKMLYSNNISSEEDIDILSDKKNISLNNVSKNLPPRRKATDLMRNSAKYFKVLNNLGRENLLTLKKRTSFQHEIFNSNKLIKDVFHMKSFNQQLTGSNNAIQTIKNEVNNLSNNSSTRKPCKDSFSLRKNVSNLKGIHRKTITEEAEKNECDNKKKGNKKENNVKTTLYKIPRKKLLKKLKSSNNPKIKLRKLKTNINNIRNQNNKVLHKENAINTKMLNSGNIEISSMKKINLSNEFKKGLDEIKSVNKFHLLDNPIGKSNQTSQFEENALFMIKPLSNRMQIDDKQNSSFYDNKNNTNDKKVSNYKKGRHIKLDLRDFENEEIFSYIGATSIKKEYHPMSTKITDNLPDKNIAKLKNASLKNSAKVINNKYLYLNLEIQIIH